MPTHRALRDVLKKQDWVTHSSTTIRNTYGEMGLLAYLQEANRWDDAKSAWMVALLPEGHVLVDRSGEEEEFALVLRVFEGAALTWPAVRAVSNLIELDTNTNLRWKVVLGTDGLDILPVACISPLHVLAQGWAAPRKGPLFETIGQPEQRLMFQARRGWRGVPEVALRKLMAALGVTMPGTGDFADCEPATAMVVALCKKVCGDTLSHNDITNMLLRRALEDEAADKPYLHHLTADMVNDVVLLKDQKGSKTFLKDWEQMHLKREAKRKQALHVAEKLVKASGSPAPRPGAKNVPAKTAQKKLDKDKARVYAGLESEPFAVLQKHKPEEARVMADALNGRYKLTYPGERVRSISWTERGHEAAVKIALEILWQWATAATNRVPPPEAAALFATT